MLNCYNVADYFLMKVDVEGGEVITNLKLQKLAYYAQSACLAFYDAPLFAETVQAWKHGPVVPELYRLFKGYSANPLPRAEGVDLGLYSPRDRKLMDDVYVFFGQFAAWKLRAMTHEETPWLEASPSEAVIPHASMRDYFRARWGDQMRAAVSDPVASLQALVDARWEPTEASREAARRYNMGHVEGDKYMSKAV